MALAVVQVRDSKGLSPFSDNNGKLSPYNRRDSQSVMPWRQHTSQVGQVAVVSTETHRHDEQGSKETMPAIAGTMVVQNLEGAGKSCFPSSCDCLSI